MAGGGEDEDEEANPPRSFFSDYTGRCSVHLSFSASYGWKGVTSLLHQ